MPQATKEFCFVIPNKSSLVRVIRVRVVEGGSCQVPTMCPKMSLFGVLLLGLASQVICKPNYVPASACDVWLPNHARIPSQKSQAPYVLNVSATEILPGEAVNVTISAPDNIKFKGFLLIAISDGKEALGSFDVGNDNNVRSCKPGSDNVAHHKGSYDKESVTVTWTAPKNFKGEVVFRATVVQEFTTFWEKIMSPTVNVKVIPVKNRSYLASKAWLKILKRIQRYLLPWEEEQQQTNFSPFSLKIPIISHPRLKRDIMFSDSEPYSFVYPKPKNYRSDRDEKFDLTKGFRDPYVSISSLFTNQKTKRQPQGEVSTPYPPSYNPYYPQGTGYPYLPYSPYQYPGQFNPFFSPYGFSPYRFSPFLNQYPYQYPANYGQYPGYPGQNSGYPGQNSGYPGQNSGYHPSQYPSYYNPSQYPSNYNPSQMPSNYQTSRPDNSNKLVGQSQYPAFPYGPYPIPQKPFETGYSGPNYPTINYPDPDRDNKRNPGSLYFPDATTKDE